MMSSATDPTLEKLNQKSLGDFSELLGDSTIQSL